MSDIKLFNLDSDGQSVTELSGQSAKLEKDLQQLIEANMDTFLGVRFLATEFTTSNGGRIDSLGLDENGCPVIVEYKRHSNDSVINQGLFYYDWLIDHKAEFQLLAMKQLGNDIGDSIEWEGARLICIASDFNKYDAYAIKQIERNIELIHYKYFGDNLMMLELVNHQSGTIKKGEQALSTNNKNNTIKKSKADPFAHSIAKAQASPALMQLYDALCDYCESLNDEVIRKELKLYTAYKRIKNFISIRIDNQKDPRIIAWLKVTPSSIELEPGFTRDVTNVGHWGTGDLEVLIRNEQDLAKAKPLIFQSFEQN